VGYNSVADNTGSVARITYTVLVETLNPAQSIKDNTGLSSFVQLLLPLKHEKCRQIPREFDLTAVQGHPRSSILVSMESHMWLHISH